MPAPSSQLLTLDRAECISRLARGGIGRIGFVDDGQPTILPVNYVLAGDEVMIRTQSGGAIHRAAHSGAEVAFEVDETDPGWHGGRSVLVRGRAKVFDDRGDPAGPGFRLRAWGSKDADIVVAIEIATITGRRIPTTS